jgi:hypothetical protein
MIWPVSVIDTGISNVDNQFTNLETRFDETLEEPPCYMIGARGGVLGAALQGVKNDLDVSFRVDVDGVVGAKPSVANTLENTPEFLISLSGSLLKAIEQFAKPEDHIRSLSVIALWLSHVDLFLELTIGKG